MFLTLTECLLSEICIINWVKCAKLSRVVMGNTEIFQSEIGKNHWNKPLPQTKQCGLLCLNFRLTGRCARCKMMVHFYFGQYGKLAGALCPKADCLSFRRQMVLPLHTIHPETPSHQCYYMSRYSAIKHSLKYYVQVKQRDNENNKTNLIADIDCVVFFLSCSLF